MNNKTTRAIKNDKIYDDDYTIDSLFENCEGVMAFIQLMPSELYIIILAASLLLVFIEC